MFTDWGYLQIRHLSPQKIIQGTLSARSHKSGASARSGHGTATHHSRSIRSIPSSAFIQTAIQHACLIVLQQRYPPRAQPYCSDIKVLPGDNKRHVVVVSACCCCCRALGFLLVGKGYACTLTLPKLGTRVQHSTTV